MTDTHGGADGQDAQQDVDPNATLPAKPTTSKQDAFANVHGHVQDVFGAGPPGGDGSIGPTTASGFLSFYPFLRLFRATAIFQRPRDVPAETHVAALRKEHPKFYGWCVGFDFLFVLVASALLLGAAAFVIYKTIVK